MPADAVVCVRKWRVSAATQEVFTTIGILLLKELKGVLRSRVFVRLALAQQRCQEAVAVERKNVFHLFAHTYEYNRQL